VQSCGKRPVGAARGLACPSISASVIARICKGTGGALGFNKEGGGCRAAPPAAGILGR